MPIRIIDATKQSFFELSEEFGDLSSLRRILSLLRNEKNCKSIVIEEFALNGDNKYQCDKVGSKSRRCISCEDYIKDMQLHIEEYTLLGKRCLKMLFFSKEVANGDKVTRDKFQDSILGYAIVHIDELKLNHESSGKNIARRYVPECVLSCLSREVRGYKYGTLNSTVSLYSGDEIEKFDIKGGNYFSQQNAITNCCAHASIKTTLRGYDEDISCSAINNALIRLQKVEKSKISEKIRRFSRGLNPQEILNAIEELSANSENIEKLSPFLITANDLPIASFVETIYRAIESKIPVILLLRIPKSIDMGNSFRGHTISIVGHTFNKHNWCAYGSGYFSNINKESYLSSYLWCDNYVVQDDNFGPAYQLPSSFLADYYDYGVTIEKMGLNIASQKELSGKSSHYPLSAIIVPPTELKEISLNIYHIENLAVEKFVQQIRHFAKKGKFDSIRKDKVKFDRYFYHVFMHQYDKPRNFIARTFIITKEEYINSASFDIYRKNIAVPEGFSLDGIVYDNLPKYFWITEISVSELYWINEAKVAEILLDVNYEKLQHFEPILIRIPYFLAVYENVDKLFTFDLNDQDEVHQPIIRKKKGLVRKNLEGENT